MTKRASGFNPALEPLATTLPSAIASAIGHAISRHCYLEWVLGQVLYSLMEISIKQGRAVVQRPQPEQYVVAVRALFAFHKLEPRFDFAAFAAGLERAHAARDWLAHGVVMQDVNSRKQKLHLVRGSWALGVDGETISRGAWPDTPKLERATLEGLRKDIESAITRAERLRELTEKLLRELHQARRTNPRFDRRRSNR